VSVAATPSRTVLIVDIGEGPLRGADQVTLTLVDGLDPGSWRFVVLTNHPVFAEACRARGVPVVLHPIRMLFVPRPRLRDLADLWRFARLTAQLIREHKVALIHSVNGSSCIWLFPAALWCRVPLLAHVHNYWSRRMRLLTGVHLADRIVGVCEGIMRGFRNDPTCAGRLSIIYNGFDALKAPVVDRAAARAAFGLGPDRVVVALIGYLVALKRGDVAIAAMRALPPDVAARVTLLVVGDGPERARWEAEAAGLPVVFVGQRDDVHHLLRNVIDIVVLPSDSEAFSMVLLEAAAAGLPRIGSNVGGIPESILDGVDGVIVPVGDAVALAGAIARLASDPALARRYGCEGHRRLREELSTTTFLLRFGAVYEELAGTSERSRLARIWTALASGLNQVKSTGYSGLRSDIG
jgi:glycosyltransferase involved in cell wall biosynthesis